MIHCTSKEDWQNVDQILKGQQPYLLVVPPEAMSNPAPAARPTPSKPAKRAAKPATRRTGEPVLDNDRLVRHIESQPRMEHSISSAIQDQIPGGIPAHVDGSRTTNPDYNSAASSVQLARKRILARTGGSFERVPGKRGLVRHKK